LGSAAEEMNKIKEAATSRDVYVAQRPVAEVFRDAFTNLFQTISQPLVWIEDWLEAWKVDAAAPETMKQLNTVIQGGADQNITKVESYLATLSDIATKQQGEVTAATTKIDKDKAQIELSKTQSEITRVSSDLAGATHAMGDATSGKVLSDLEAKINLAALTTITGVAKASDTAIGTDVNGNPILVKPAIYEAPKPKNLEEAASAAAIKPQTNWQEIASIPMLFKKDWNNLFGNPNAGATAAGVTTTSAGTSPAAGAAPVSVVTINNVGHTDLFAHPKWMDDIQTTDHANPPPNHIGTTPNGGKINPGRPL
jgi:hypothetical protein